MPTYLMKWNATLSGSFVNLDESLKKIQSGHRINLRWSCGNNKKIHTGDRMFLIRLGLEPKGILASGRITSNVSKDTHWDKQHASKGKQALYVKVDFDVLLDPSTEPLLSLSELKKGIFAKMSWDTPPSGIIIPEKIARELERKWAQFLHNTTITQPSIDEEDLSDQSTFPEGSISQVVLNKYERNPEARAACLNHYGYDCAVCGFNFEREFPNIGDNFIHVHHLVPLSKRRKHYEVNPIEDLRPVCPNCHAMIHKRKPEPFTIEELRKFHNDK